MSRLNTASVLKFLRDHGEHSLQQVAEQFNVHPWPPRGTVRQDGRPPASLPVEALFKAGLLRITRASNGEALPLSEFLQANIEPCEVMLAMADVEAWRRLQTALSPFSLSELTAVQSGNSMVVVPAFGLPRPATAKRELPEVLLLMPFAADLNPVYDAIRMVVLSCGMTVARADDFFGDGVVMHDVWSAICKARLIIADCTGRNANVFYELGLAHAVGKTTLLITQEEHDIPFDIRHRRVIEYDLTKLPKLRIALEARIRKELEAEPMAGHNVSASITYSEP